jgi:hypothetical protein
VDADGYGYKPGERGVERLLEDLRTFSPAGIDRAASGWREHDVDNHERLHSAERAALKALESADAAADWEDLRRKVLDLTEGRGSLVAWKAEHGDTGHQAEDATLAAGLAVLARDKISRGDYEVLVSGLAEALPWLLLAD